MKKVLLTTAFIAALGTSATAQGITPVTTAPATDVTVGTMVAQTGLLIGLGTVAVIIAAAASSSDGTN
ncbi:hypothetical protein KUL25_18360 [Rhodobacteraceae bacterium N5(2021)]|uniref:Uncharacterized protein n=1 Tax=Gymnodinialimonas phycosphaerae TaxID=2841589 RepID=A0A975TQX9_9RHOB|nr:hypothetical protein [Gymnodinialimonas phycosphaerae]MBY4893385.1 hypothetical protein [Gymnodinialimonas phycosphaerae]MBY4894726.1 hypothetical protein [Gymnodinialimonas phycosphaerae]